MRFMTDGPLWAYRPRVETCGFQDPFGGAHIPKPL